MKKNAHLLPWQNKLVPEKIWNVKFTQKGQNYDKNA